MSLKRKRDNDDNEEFGGNMGQVLPVARLPPDFDPATAAGEMDGAVYLALVRRDAQARPHTTRVPNPFLAASAVPTILRVNGDGDDDAALPSDEWRATFERRFRAFRANLRHTPIHVGRPPARVAVPGWTDRDGWWAFINGLPPPPSKTKPKPQAKPKPAQRTVVVLDADALMYDEVQAGWGGARDFVPTARAQVEDFVPAARADFAPAARAQEDFVPAARTQADDEWQQIEDGELPDDAGPLDWAQDDDDEPEPEPEPEAGEVPRSPSPPIARPREPSRALLECINHRTTLQLLKHFRHWLTLSPSPPLSHLHARWLFALLAHAAPPAELVADEMSVLRQTAKAVLARIRRLRECADEADSVEMVQQRADEEGTGAGEEETAWWLVFAAVAAGFAQRDLWDEARAVLG